MKSAQTVSTWQGVGEGGGKGGVLPKMVYTRRLSLRGSPFSGAGGTRYNGLYRCVDHFETYLKMSKLSSQLGAGSASRALHQYPRGHGFESHLNVFSGFSVTSCV